MNRPSILPLAVCGLAAAASAQTPTNQWGIYPAETTFATRVFVPTTDQADVMVRVDGSTVRGVGAASGRTAGRVIAMRGTIQDSDRSTGETYGFCILPDDPASPGTPDANPANELLRVTPFTTPASGTGGVAWLLTVTLGTPADVLPIGSTYHIGMELWAGSENRMWAAHYTSGTEGDNPKPTAPNVTNVVNRTVGSIQQPSPRTMRVYVLTDMPVLEPAADVDVNFQRGPNPAFGVAGYYPDRARQDGLGFRVRDAANPSGPFAVFATAFGFAPAPFPLPGVDGSVQLGLPLLPIAIASGTLDGQTGEAEVTAVPYPVGPASAFGQLQFQAAILSLQFTGRLSNAVQADDR